ncbi:MAG: DUF3108 domain-containing protein [Gammaproteobacteria bacterium]|nr:MAG: DUF3108 domain-containing protein [Gammaproteobacteria bacterium]
MRLNQWLTAFFGICLSLAASANSTLNTFDNTYSAKLFGFNITVNSKLDPLSNGNYLYTFNASSSVGKVAEGTEIKWLESEKRVLPLRYTYKRKGLGKDRDDELIFDWATLKLTNVRKNQVTNLDANQRLHDSLSYQVQLSQDLIAGKNNFSYAVTNGRKIKNYKFEIVGEEVLQTPLGEVKTVKVKRSRENDDLVTYAWFAKDFQHLLVRMQQEEDGSDYTIYISKASINGKVIEHF